MKRYCLIYRTGGTENYVWHRSYPYRDRKEAVERRIDLERLGYKAHVEDYARSVGIGLPSTYEVHQ